MLSTNSIYSNAHLVTNQTAGCCFSAIFTQPYLICLLDLGLPAGPWPWPSWPWLGPGRALASPPGPGPSKFTRASSMSPSTRRSTATTARTRTTSSTRRSAAARTRSSRGTRAGRAARRFMDSMLKWATSRSRPPRARRSTTTRGIRSPTWSTLRRPRAPS